MRPIKYRQGNNTMKRSAEITSDLANEIFADALRRRVGPGKKFGVDVVSDATGIKRRTIDGWRQGDTAPCFYKTLQLITVLGQGFRDEITAVAIDRSGDADPAQSATEILDVAKQLLERCHDDGKFCHRDAAHMIPILIELSGLAETLAHRLERLTKSGGYIVYGAIPHEDKVRS